MLPGGAHAAAQQGCAAAAGICSAVVALLHRPRTIHFLNEGALPAGAKKRHRGDSNPCGQSPMDFESISLAARTQCLVHRGFKFTLAEEERARRTDPDNQSSPPPTIVLGMQGVPFFACVCACV